VSLWSGRVEGALDPAVWDFLRADDAELLPYDCEATAEHAQRLHGAGLLTDAELSEVERRLAEIAQDPDGYLASDEDVHSAIERCLGEVGRKIHAGRSRNDQVAAALRLYVLDACAEAREEIDALALVTLSFAEAEADTLMPGYTHLQRGQPVTLGHHLLAWAEMLDRDRTRFAAAAEAAATSPLGAGALAGSTLGLGVQQSNPDPDVGGQAFFFLAIDPRFFSSRLPRTPRIRLRLAYTACFSACFPSQFRLPRSGSEI